MAFEHNKGRDNALYSAKFNLQRAVRLVEQAEETEATVPKARAAREAQTYISYAVRSLKAASRLKGR